MAYVNSPFPERIAFGAERSSGWATTINRTAGGYANTNQAWADALHSYDVSLSVRVASDFALVLDHFHAVRGRANAFPFKDFLDYTVTAAQGVATLVSGSIYQLGKVYSATNAYTRRITRPVSGTCTFYRTRSAVQSVIAPTVDYGTGQITVSGHVAGDTYQWAGEFRVPVRYQDDKLPAVAVNKEPSADGELFVAVDSIVLEEDRE